MSTWGQLRMLLQTSCPGVSLDLLDEWLNERYKSVLSATDWNGLKSHWMLQTEAAYNSVPGETVTLTVGSATVTGTATYWSDVTGNPYGYVTGRQFFRPGDRQVYVIAAINSLTSITLDRPYEGNGTDFGATYSGQPYTMMRDIYTLPDDASVPVTIINPATGKPMGEFTKDGMDVSRGTRATTGDPWSFCIYDDTPETSPPVAHQVQLYPPPKYARGFDTEYLRNANIFTGENTKASPLPFVTDTVLLSGARADAWLHLENFQKAAGYQVAYQTELDRMLLAEHTRNRKTTSFHMETRFTRHRAARVDRQYGRMWGPGQGGPN